MELLENYSYSMIYVGSLMSSSPNDILLATVDMFGPLSEGPGTSTLIGLGSGVMVMIGSGTNTVEDPCSRLLWLDDKEGRLGS